jgi:hypothetical protein
MKTVPNFSLGDFWFYILEFRIQLSLFSFDILMKLYKVTEASSVKTFGIFLKVFSILTT